MAEARATKFTAHFSWAVYSAERNYKNKVTQCLMYSFEGVFAIMWDYEMSGQFILQPESWKTCLRSCLRLFTHRCLISLMKMTERRTYRSFTLDLVCGSSLRNSKGCLKIRNDTVWCYCGLQRSTESADSRDDVTSLRLKRGETFLHVLVRWQIVGCDRVMLLVVFNSSSPWRLRESQSLQQGLVCRWPSVAPRQTYLKKSPRVHADQVISWRGIASSCEKASCLQLSTLPIIDTVHCNKMWLCPFFKIIFSEY